MDKGKVCINAKRKVNGEWVDIDIDEIDWETINEIHVKGKYHFVRNHWIPVTERLPEAECGESESVLVCFENGTQDVLYFNGGNWCYPTGETYISRNYKNGWHNEVAAWMPLPESWEGETNED